MSKASLLKLQVMLAEILTGPMTTDDARSTGGTFGDFDNEGDQDHFVANGFTENADEVKFDASHLPTDIYFFRLEKEEKVKVRKMIYLR